MTGLRNRQQVPNMVMGLSEEDSVRFVQDKLTGDYNELSEDLKYLVKDKYERVMAAKSADDIKAL